MRWSMVPVSAAAHSVVLLVLIVLPVGVGEVPTPLARAGTTVYAPVVAAPQVPVPAVSPPRGAHAAPTQAREGIRRDADVVRPAASVPDGGLPYSTLGATPGVPTDLGMHATVAPTPPPPPVAEPVRIVRVGGVIRPPRKLSGLAPVYPESARAARVEGRVVIEAVVDENGFVTDARVLHSIPLLDGPALTAIKTWRYTPTLLNGVPVRVLMTVTFNFELSGRLP